MKKYWNNYNDEFIIDYVFNNYNGVIDYYVFENGGYNEGDCW